MKKPILTASAIALASASGAFAQEAFDLGEIAVFANKAGEETELKRTGATIEVVTEDDLQKASETTVADYLSTLPGLTVSANGGIGANTQIRIRGLDGKYIKVMVNGIDVTDPSQPQTQFNWAGMTTSSVSRIEVMKGSSSSLYGSRAIGGVINITTAPQGDEPGNKATVAAEAGSENTRRAEATVSHRTERGGLSLTVNRVQTDGFSANAAGTEPDGYQGTQITLSGDVQATDVLRLGFSTYYLNAEGDFDEFGGDGAPPYDENNTTDTRAARAWAQLQTGVVTHELSYTYYKNDRVSSSNGFDSVFNGKRKKLDYVGTWTRSEALSVTYGADWEQENFDSGFDMGEETSTGLFGEVLYAPTADLNLAASLRYDNYDSFGGNLSGRLAAAWQVTDATTINAVAATGFRAPSLYELNSTLYGNPNLQPEESRSLELGVVHQYGNGSHVRATAFYTEIDNLIQFVTLSFVPFTGQYQQVPGTSRSKGIELAGVWEITDTARLIGNYTYTDAKDATGARLLRVPRHDASIGIEADFAERWRGALTVHHVADRPDEFGTVMADYTVANATLSYDITDRATAYLRLENLTDEDYQTAGGFNAAGRGIFAGIRAAF